MTVRVERVHEYTWWEGHASGRVSVSAAETNDGRPAADVVLYNDADKERIMCVEHREIPALIAALTSYQSRINAAENEETK